MPSQLTMSCISSYSDFFIYIYFYNFFFFFINFYYFVHEVFRLNHLSIIKKKLLIVNYDEYYPSEGPRE